MNKSNRYLKEWIQEWKDSSVKVYEPRTKWSDGTPAYYRSIHQKVAEYDLNKGEFPINTLRPTAIKGGFHEIQWFYQKQSNDLNVLHPSVHSWWEDFVVSDFYGDYGFRYRNIGETYGYTVDNYDLTNKLLKGLIENPFSRRHQIDLWQYSEQRRDPKALPPCVFLNMWSVAERPIPKGKEFIEKWNKGDRSIYTKIRYLNLTLVQRSMDGLMTFSINPTQYSMMALMIVSHLNYHTPYYWEVGKLLHIINDFHIYDRHEQYVDEILQREDDGIQPKIKLGVYKDFYDISWDDFEIVDYVKPKPLSGKLEIAI